MGMLTTCVRTFTSLFNLLPNLTCKTCHHLQPATFTLQLPSFLAPTDTARPPGHADCREWQTGWRQPRRGTSIKSHVLNRCTPGSIHSYTVGWVLFVGGGAGKDQLAGQRVDDRLYKKKKK